MTTNLFAAIPNVSRNPLYCLLVIIVMSSVSKYESESSNLCMNSVVRVVMKRVENGDNMKTKIHFFSTTVRYPIISN